MSKITIEITDLTPAKLGAINAFVDELQGLLPADGTDGATPPVTTARRTRRTTQTASEPLPLQQPAQTAGIELFKSDGSSAGFSLDGATAAKVLIEALKVAPDRASLDNLLTVNARAMQQMVEVDSAGVTRAYAEKCSGFAAAPKTVETPKGDDLSALGGDKPKTSSLDDLMGEVGADNAPTGMPTDPKELKEAVRTMTSKQIDKLGMEKAREWIAKYGAAFSKIPADKYPALWTELTSLGFTA